jgi:uncharacterized membrane protein YfcA
MINLIENLSSNLHLSLVLFLIFTFIVSGIIKGFLGLGLPSTAMGLLTLVIEPIHAISIMVAPILFSNIFQYARSSQPYKTFTELKVFALFIIVSIFVTSLFITAYPRSLLTIAIGSSMVIFSLNQWFGFKIQIGPSYSFQVLIGTLSGVLGGLSSIWSPPVAMYLIARDYNKEDFISATGFLFMVGGIPLGLGLYFAGVLTFVIAIQSFAALIFVLIGFRIGEYLRSFVNQQTFRNSVLVAFIILGSRLIYEGAI